MARNWGFERFRHRFRDWHRNNWFFSNFLFRNLKQESTFSNPCFETNQWSVSLFQNKFLDFTVSWPEIGNETKKLNHRFVSKQGHKILDFCFIVSKQENETTFWKQLFLCQSLLQQLKLAIEKSISYIWIYSSIEEIELRSSGWWAGSFSESYCSELRRLLAL